MGFTLGFESLKAWCQRQRHELRVNAEQGQLALGHQILGEEVPLLILPQLARGVVMFVMQLPFAAAPARRAAAAESAALLNASSFMGTWVVSGETGAIYFRVTVPALDIEYSDAGLLHVVRIVVGTTEKAAPGYRAVVLENAAPETAVPKL